MSAVVSAAWAGVLFILPLVAMLEFLMLPAPKWGPPRLQAGWTERSLVTCAVVCHDRLGPACKSVMYNDVTRLCTPGGCLSKKENPPTSDEGNLHIVMDCDSSDGFKAHWHGNALACVRLFVPGKEWPLAVDHCKNHSSFLAVVKSVDKLDLLRGLNFPRRTWIGLGFSDTEGKYKWIDDNSDIDTALVEDMFRNKTLAANKNKRCVEIQEQSYGGFLSACNCSKPHEFVCERASCHQL